MTSDDAIGSSTDLAKDSPAGPRPRPLFRPIDFLFAAPSAFVALAFLGAVAWANV